MPKLTKPKYEQSHAPKSTTVLYFNGDLTSVDSVMWVVTWQETMDVNPYATPNSEPRPSDEIHETPTIRQCHHCHCEEFKTWTLLNPLIIHWVLNPGLAVNELFFGQRIPRTVFLCRDCGSWLKPNSQFIECPKCKRFHSAVIWRQCGFGNWLGLVCPDCGASIPSVLNLTSILILAILSPVLFPLSLWLRTPYRKWAQGRIVKSRLSVQSQSGT